MSTFSTSVSEETASLSLAGDPNNGLGKYGALVSTLGQKFGIMNELFISESSFMQPDPGRKALTALERYVDDASMANGIIAELYIAVPTHLHDMMRHSSFFHRKVRHFFLMSWVLFVNNYQNSSSKLLGKVDGLSFTNCGTKRLLWYLATRHCITSKAMIDPLFLNLCSCSRFQSPTAALELVHLRKWCPSYSQMAERTPVKYFGMNPLHAYVYCMSIYCNNQLKPFPYMKLAT